MKIPVEKHGLRPQNGRMPSLTGPIEVPTPTGCPARVWKISTEGVERPLGHLLPLLNLREREQVRIRKTIESQRSYAVAHVAMREILAAELGIDPMQVTYMRSPGFGKPLLLHDGSGLTFNLSHTHGLALIALADRGRIGVDVEWLGRQGAYMPLAKRYFTAAECADLESVPADLQRKRFLTLWTRREAYAKMTGEGLRRAIGDQLGSDGKLAGISPEMVDLEPTSNHVGALAIQVGGYHAAGNLV